jgi:hypothetical protein
MTGDVGAFSAFGQGGREVSRPGNERSMTGERLRFLGRQLDGEVDAA